eukprot:TRINITY_DN1819_c7_g1_i1.p1 TRINITY_DN1819_c7_g1~~TRINITY_DN1819_c7_g1_i1.p1  ORF type:complete len:450 (+),score=144.46 TRINITY_DN1819_c7_g1_i1:222-1571(+)
MLIRTGALAAGVKPAALLRSASAAAPHALSSNAHRPAFTSSRTTLKRAFRWCSSGATPPPPPKGAGDAGKAEEAAGSQDTASQAGGAEAGGEAQAPANGVRRKETPEELTKRLQQMRDVQRRFDLDAPMELQMRQGGNIETSEDLPPRYRFTAPATVKKRMWEEHMQRLEKIPDVTVIRGQDGKVKLVDIPVDAVTKAELDYNFVVLQRVGYAVYLSMALLFSGLGAIIYMTWWVLSADPGPPPNEHIGAKVFLDIFMEEERIGTVVLGLYTERCPMTCENFHRLVTGNTANGETLRGSAFFDVFRNFGIVGGDYARNTGSGARPVLPYLPGKRFFPDEIKGRDLPFFKGALCSVAPLYTKKLGQNDSLFMLSLAGTMKHNHSFVIFGEVLSGQDVLDMVPALARSRGTKPSRRIWIKRCGVYNNTPEERERANTVGPAVITMESGRGI